MPIRRIIADIGELFVDAPTIILDADASAADTTITVQSIIGVSVDDILFFREPGNERAEIIAVHAVTAPSGNTVTLVAALVEAHPAGTLVYIIQANQIRFYRGATEVDANSDDSSLTALAAAQNIDPTINRNFYNDTTQTSGFYWYRFENSITSINLLYSDAIAWSIVAPAFAEEEVGYIIEEARSDLGKDWDAKFSKQKAIRQVNACLQYMEGKLKRWERYMVSDFAIGQTARGVFDFALPSDIYDSQTNRSILQVKLGQSELPLTPKDEREMEEIMGDVRRTTVRNATVVGNTTLDIVNSYDFSDDGDINIYTANTLDAITYGAVTRSATVGVLTGIAATGDAAITAIHAVGQNVWQSETEGKPQYFNVREGRLRIWYLPNASYVNLNVFLDYYTQATRVDSEADTIDFLRVDAVKHWLKWKMDSVWNHNGQLDLSNGDYLMFRDVLTQAIRTTSPHQKRKWKPKINEILYTSGRATDDFDRS